MPFDGMPELDIAGINSIVLAARADGRLICDNHKLPFESPFKQKIGGVTYVCAVAAVEEVIVVNFFVGQLILEHRHLQRLMTAHDRLASARTSRHKARIARREADFDALLAKR
jgi:hypothetical protein